jgi:hypothetical protein
MPSLSAQSVGTQVSLRFASFYPVHRCNLHKEFHQNAASSSASSPIFFRDKLKAFPRNQMVSRHSSGSWPKRHQAGR